MVLEGVLKQQFTEADGRLSWERRHVSVDPDSASLAISDVKDENPTPTTTISLRGVKYAKEWSFSSAVSGYGFDLVWFSGQLWSFMSAEENECRQWVAAINAAIAGGIRKSADRTGESQARPPLPPQAPRDEMIYNQGVNTRGLSDSTNPNTFISGLVNTSTVQSPTWVESAKRYQSSYDHNYDELSQFGQRAVPTIPDINRRSGDINLVSSFQSDHGHLTGDQKGTHLYGASNERHAAGQRHHHDSYEVHRQAHTQHQPSDIHRDTHSAAVTHTNAAVAESGSAHSRERAHEEWHSDHHLAHDALYRRLHDKHHQQALQKADMASQSAYDSNGSHRSSEANSNRPRDREQESHQHHVYESAEHQLGHEHQNHSTHHSRSQAHSSRHSDNRSQDEQSHASERGHSGHQTDSRGSCARSESHEDTSVERHTVEHHDHHNEVHRTRDSDHHHNQEHHSQQDHGGAHGRVQSRHRTSSADTTVSADHASNQEGSVSVGPASQDPLLRSRDTLDASVQGSVQSNAHHNHSGAANGTDVGQTAERLQFSRLPPEGMKLPTAASAPLSHVPYGTAHRLNHVHLSGESLPAAAHIPSTTSSAHMAERVESEKVRTLQSMSMDRPTAQVFAQEIATWQSKCQILEMQLERKSNELETAKQRQTQLQDKLDQVAAECEQRLDLARDRERQLLADTKRELENKMLRMSNENMSFFEAANKSAKLQHERELTCLREELAEERKRHTGLLDRSQALRERAEKAEAEAQHELSTLRDKYSTLHVEETRVRRELEIERAAFEKERTRLAKEHEAALTAAQEEKERVQVAAHRELRDKIAELNEKMQASLQQIRQSDAEAVRHELEGRRIRDLAELHKKCQADIEAVRTEERRLAAIEIENIRNAFLSREHQTAEDLVQLERLHGTRVSQLEQQLQALRAENGSLQERLRAAQLEAQHGSQQAQRGEAEMRSRVEGYAQRAEVLHRELLDAHKEIQEGKAREAGYREQLSQAITQNRLQHAELLEAKQQVSSGSAAVFQWRNATRESDLSISAAETALRISRDEVAMLEHQLKRVEEENALLKLELQRSDRLVYGANMANARASGGAVINDAHLGLNATSLSTAYLLRGTMQTPTAKVSPPPGHTAAALSQSMLSGTTRSVKTRKAATPKR